MAADCVSSCCRTPSCLGVSLLFTQTCGQLDNIHWHWEGQCALHRVPPFKNNLIQNQPHRITHIFDQVSGHQGRAQPTRKSSHHARSKQRPRAAVGCARVRCPSFSLNAQTLSVRLRGFNLQTHTCAAAPGARHGEHPFPREAPSAPSQSVLPIPSLALS